MFEKPDVLYTAEATAAGGREGHARASRVDVDLDVPAEMAGRAAQGRTFATGWAACLQSALLRFAVGRKLDLSDSRVTARVWGSGPFPAVAWDLSRRSTSTPPGSPATWPSS